MEHLNLQALADNLSLFAFIYLCVFGAIVMDLWSGVRKARRRHELRMSNGYKRTVDKIARYYNMLLVVSIMDALLIVSQAHSFCSLPCLPYLTIIGALFLCFIELKSIFEKAEDKTKFAESALLAGKIIANKDDLKKGFVPVCVVCAIFIGIGLLPTNENGVVSYGKVPEYIELYYIQAIVTIVMIIMLGVLIYVVAEKKLDYMKIASAMTAVAVVICMTSSIVYGVSQGTDNTDYINRAINGGDSINMDKLESGSENFNADNNFYRIDTSENVDNWCMFWKLSSMRCFHSVVSTSIMDFYSSIGQTRDVASRMETKVYPLRSLFSVKYYFNELTESERKGITEVSKPETLANLYGFEYVDTQNGFNIYENKYYVPMGFTYDYYCLDSDIQKASEVDKTSMLMKALVLTPEQAAKYNNILSYYSFKGTDYSTDQYYQNCLDRRANSCSSFSYDSYGFNAKIDLDKDNLVFFSVPYDDGWSAKVNGQDVEIEKVDYGFMAVLCPAGSNDIQFTYETKGLFWGKVITAVGFGSLIVYLGAVRFTGRKKKEEAQPVEKNA